MAGDVLLAGRCVHDAWDAVGYFSKDESEGKMMCRHE
jgi:hypothetical protein